jgi:hypothetical protein
LIEILRDRVGRLVEPSGADLYRLNCQSCHGAEGTGSPPEIKSVLGLVQGSPLELVRQPSSVEQDLQNDVDFQQARSSSQ